MAERKFPIGSLNSICGSRITRRENPDGTFSLTFGCPAKDKNPKTCPRAAYLPITTTIDPRFMSEQIEAKLIEESAQALHDTCLGPIDPNLSN